MHRREPGCIRTQGKAINMPLQHRFADPQSNLALELFLRMTRDLFEERLVSVVLYGSIVFDDLAPGYGDLDFLAVVMVTSRMMTVASSSKCAGLCAAASMESCVRCWKARSCLARC